MAVMEPTKLLKQPRAARSIHWEWCACYIWLPRLVMTNIANWKITMLFMRRLTISMAMLNSYVSHYQRVHHGFSMDLSIEFHMADLMIGDGWSPAMPSEVGDFTR